MAIVSALVLFTSQSVFATDFYWDANGATAGTGGAGNWDADSSLWRSGSDVGSLSLWPNTDPNNADTAQLAGTAGTLALNSSSININVNKITFGTTGYTIAAPGSGTATLNLEGTTPTIAVGTLSATITAKITGSAGLTLTGSGSGTLTLSGANTHTGVTTLNSGTLKLQGANMWKTARTYTINSGAVLHLDGGVNFGTGTAATTTINGTGTLRVTSGAYTRGSDPGAAITIAMTGGTIDIQSGATLQIGGWSYITWTGNSGSLNVDGTFDFADGNNSVTVDALTGAGTITKTWGTETKTLTVGTAGGSGVFSGVIQNLSGKIALTKNGTGNLTLSGANTYTGGTTISGGTLIITSPCNLANGALNVGGNSFVYRPTAAGAMNIGSGGLTLNNGSITTAIGGTASQSAITSGWASLSGTGTVNIYGVPGVAHTAGVNNLITAGSGLTGGTYTLGKVYNNTDFTVSALTRSETAISTTVSTATPITTAYWKGGLSGASNVWAASDGSAGCNWVTAAGGGASAVVPGSAADVIFSANTVSITPVGSTLGADMTIKTLAIADTANGLSLNSDGYTLTITPASAAAGLTMNASVPLSYIAAKVNLGADQTWTLNSANALIVAGIISGTHALTKAGTGTLVLSGANTCSGSVTVSGGTLVIGAGSGGRTLANSMVLNGGTVLGGQDNVGSGGTIIVDGNGVTHIFTASGSLVLPVDVQSSELIVGGGGGGGGGTSGTAYNAGGGGGEVRNLTLQALSAGTMAVTVGAGGSGANGASASDGTASSIGANSAAGGFGAKVAVPVANSKGGTSGSGKMGGALNGTAAGGGGGDSSVGNVGVNSTTGGTGGTGTAASTIAGLAGYGVGQVSSGNAYFGGGGGGGGSATGAGGLGGGGSNSQGTSNTGGGGSLTSAGGSGIVVVQYPYALTAGTVTLSGGIDLRSASTLDAYGSGGLLDVTTSPITTSTGSGGLTIASSSTAGGVVRFGNSNTYKGDTTINSGAILRMNAANAIPYGSGKGNVTANGTLDLNGNSTQLNGLSGSGIVDGTSGTPTLTVGNNDATSTFDGLIQNTGGTLSLTKSGSGTLTLSNANTYTGNTTINQGTLALGANNVFADTTAISIGAATLDASTHTDTAGTLDVTAGASINLGSGGQLIFANSNGSWAGTLTITGAFVSGQSLKFGSNNQGLSAAQLTKISIAGVNAFGLDANGYLVNLSKQGTVYLLR